MARGSGTKNDLVECKYCGEKYSVTYKHCPFCNEDGTGSWDDPAAEESAKGGKRLASNGPGRGKRPSVGTIVGLVLSLALIIAAICIVVSIVRPFLGGKTPKPSPVPSAPVVTASQKPAETAPVAETAPPVETADPAETDAPPEPTTPEVDVIKPTSFTINRDDMSFFNPGEYYDLKIRMVPADATAEVTWTSSDPNIASVSWNGRVVAVSKGTVTVTAKIEGVGEQSCIVRCQLKDQTAAPSAGGETGTSNPEGPTASGLTINRDDFTLSKKGETWRLKIGGTESPVTWTSSNDAVATVDSTGLVTGVGRGTCTVTAEVDGETLKCIVRCSFKE